MSGEMPLTSSRGASPAQFGCRLSAQCSLGRSPGSHSNVHALRSRFNAPADSVPPPSANKPGFEAPGIPQAERRPFPSHQRPEAPTCSPTPKPKPPPKKPCINAVSMDTRFRPPVPAGKVTGFPPAPNKPAAGSVAALREGLQKGGQDESKGLRPSNAVTPKPLGSKFPPADGPKPAKFMGTRNLITDGENAAKPTHARLPSVDGEKTPKFPAAKFPPAGDEKQSKFGPAASPKPPAAWMKPSVVKQSESETQKETSGQSSAHNDTGSTHNAAGLVQMQKNLFLGRQNISESPKEVSSNNVGTDQSSISPVPVADPSGQPKKKPLPSKVSLGMCPAKPRRPPLVDLELFRGHGSSGSLSFQADDFPPPPPEAPPAVPPLPLRVVNEESYDDVGVMNTSRSKPGQSSEAPEDEFNDDSETYEDIEERWPNAENEKPNETKDTDTSKKDKESKKQKKKMEKEEKEKAERERKEKKEMEKREHEARKKFKLKGPVEVLLRGSARVDCKGGKTDLELEKGEALEVVRMIGNPTGRWLARDSHGYYGYVKTDLVDVDGNDKQALSQDVYDDVAAPDQSNSSTKASLPESDDIYDCVDEGGSDSSFPLPPPPPPPPDADGDTYDDVISTSLLSAPQIKTEEMDVKKKKKFEKEVKEFRKKFKYEQEIHVLYEATVVPVLACKKFGSKDLVIKPGDAISVITEPKDGKVIGRNSDGKFGFVSVSNLQQSCDIYDDVGEDCVYDND